MGGLQVVSPKCLFNEPLLVKRFEQPLHVNLSHSVLICLLVLVQASKSVMGGLQVVSRKCLFNEPSLVKRFEQPLHVNMMLVRMIVEQLR
jgi:hypothetical protein